MVARVAVVPAPGLLVRPAPYFASLKIPCATTLDPNASRPSTGPRRGVSPHMSSE